MLSEISQTENDEYHMTSFVWNLANKTRNKFIYTENRLVVAGIGMGKMDEQDQKTQTSSYNVNKS